MTLEDAVRKMTSLPADMLGLYDRGRIAPGMAADIVIFDPDRFKIRRPMQNQLCIPRESIWCLSTGQSLSIMERAAESYLEKFFFTVIRR